jgi:hypothetical protein
LFSEKFCRSAREGLIKYLVDILNLSLNNFPIVSSIAKDVFIAKRWTFFGRSGSTGQKVCVRPCGACRGEALREDGSVAINKSSDSLTKPRQIWPGAQAGGENLSIA